jgi:hypothetical protein
MIAKSSLFLIGAGFNVDAGRYPSPEGTKGGYPLMPDVARLCFGLEPDQIPAGKSIEDLFADALVRSDYKPLEKLSDRLMECDWKLAWPLATHDKSNHYQEFFDTFPTAHFLTFNYDSLPELFLFRKRRWFPHDGYGVPVNVELPTLLADKFKDKKSSNTVLHLHGSLCLYTSEFKIQRRAGDSYGWLSPHDRPVYGFDADSIASCFSPYRRMMSESGYVHIEERIIAPVPNKAAELKQPFISETYSKGCALVRESGRLVALGYSFNTHDRVSYGPVLEALLESRERKLVVISPNASRLRDEIREEYPRLRVEAVEKTFGGWASDSFRGV